ncbi:MAG: peptidylprolyl isomerase [Smithellaceae bacterium]
MYLKWTRVAVMLFMFAALLQALGCSKDERLSLEPDAVEQESFVVLENEDYGSSDQDLMQAASGDVVLSVNGKGLKRNELQNKIRFKMNLQKARIPANQKQQIQEGIKKQLIDIFILKTILGDEADRRNISVTQVEIDRETKKVRDRLPTGKKLEDYFKENDMRQEDIALGIRIRKLVQIEMGEQASPNRDDIHQFYQENLERFTTGESVHVRHILLAINASDDPATRLNKKEKIDDIRKQLLDGADFAEMAMRYSECPSREKGGDLGMINKNQMVRPFEEAAFSQKINAIGDVVSTEYGHHIIQVIERQPSRIIKFEDVKDSIARYLEQEKEVEALSRLTARLREKAQIIQYEKR